jgi:hypothetical protein
LAENVRPRRAVRDGVMQNAGHEERDMMSEATTKTGGAAATNALVLGTSPLLPIVLQLGAALVAWERRERTRAVLGYLGGRPRRTR